MFFLFKQKTAYEMRISDWSSDVCSSDLGDAPAIWRGPMVTQAFEQMLRQTNWRDLDYLIIDMPPGTGDLALTLAQKVPVVGAVIVTTQIGRASCREECVSTCRSRWSPYHKKKKNELKNAKTTHKQ